MSVEIIQTGIEGCTIETQPIFGDATGGVMHMLSGGVKNPEWFGGDLLDVYASYGRQKNTMRGGHYHPVLNELFFTVSGKALWILSDFREGSVTKGKTVAMILGDTEPKPLQRLRVPAGVYHAIAAIDDAGFTIVALGTTAYDKEDYRYPSVDEVPGMKEILDEHGVTVQEKK